MAKKKAKTGRKKVDPQEKVILVGFYIKRSVVTSLGGMEKTRLLAKEFAEQHAIDSKYKEKDLV